MSIVRQNNQASLTLSWVTALRSGKNAIEVYELCLPSTLWTRVTNTIFFICCHYVQGSETSLTSISVAHLHYGKIHVQQVGFKEQKKYFLF
jgi:hypothetical protein